MSQSLIRLNKHLASLGVASRRQVDLLISQNKISINGVIAKLGDKVDPATDIIKLNNKIVQKANQELVYIMLHKPKYVLSTSSDDRGRTTVIDLVKSATRLYPVGRLDFLSTGLIILTNDGDLALKLTHPRYHLPKTYLVTLRGSISSSQIQKLESGIMLEDGRTAPSKVRRLSPSEFEITLFQGKNRQVRRMCLALGLRLVALHRLSIGSLKLGNLAVGKFRQLTTIEVKQLLFATIRA